MTHLNITNFKGSITDWTKINYLWGGLDDDFALVANARVNSTLYNYIKHSDNLANIQDNSVTDKDIDYVADNGTQTLTLNGTSSGGSYKNFDITTIPAGTYYVTVVLSGTVSTSCNLYLMSPDIQSGAQIGTTANPLSNQQVTFNTDVKYLRINVTASGIEFDNLEIKLMVSRKPIVAYEPYDAWMFYENVGVVDMGTLDWFISSGIFVTNISDIKRAPSSTTAGNILCSKYTTVAWSEIGTDKSICVISTANQVRVNDTEYTTAASFKTAMSGTYLYYELETPQVHVM